MYIYSIFMLNIYNHTILSLFTCYDGFRFCCIFYSYSYTNIYYSSDSYRSYYSEYLAIFRDSHRLHIMYTHILHTNIIATIYTYSTYII